MFSLTCSWLICYNSVFYYSQILCVYIGEKTIIFVNTINAEKHDRLAIKFGVGHVMQHPYFKAKEITFEGTTSNNK